jgi:hypothetical protein
VIVIPYKDQEIAYSELGNTWSVTMSGMQLEFKSLLQAKAFVTNMNDYNDDTERLQAIREFDNDRKGKLQW